MTSIVGGDGAPRAFELQPNLIAVPMKVFLRSLEPSCVNWNKISIV